MNAFDEFRSDFDIIVRTCFAGWHKNILRDSRPYTSYLYQTILEVSRTSSHHFRLYPEDIEQQLRVIWLEAIQSFEKSHPRIKLRQYLIRMSIWGLRDWLRKEGHVVLIGPNWPDTWPNIPIFSLGLGFLSLGSDWAPLASLTPYERYLIYLQFVDDKSILQISRIVQRDRHSISEDIEAILAKIRGKLNGKETYSR
jgi:DNA-directed RNA polymerase specialized sigma24 family protein